MKNTLTFITMILLLSGGLGFQRETPAEERVQRKTVLRESEILGTLETPQLSTELPWKNPEGISLGSSQPHRSFIKEIFRPVVPLEEPHSKK